MVWLMLSEAILLTRTHRLLLLPVPLVPLLLTVPLHLDSVVVSPALWTGRRAVFVARGHVVMVRLMAGLRVGVGPPGDGGSQHIGDLDDLGVGNDGAASGAITKGEVEDGTGGVEASAPVERRRAI